MKVWITKYALTQGILEREVELPLRDYPTMIKVCDLEYYHGSEWHVTRKAALIEAEQMRGRKIKSLERQLTKLKKLSFEHFA